MSDFTPEELEERRRRLHASEWSAVIAQWYADVTGVDLAPCGTMIHPEHPWIAATPDRLCWPKEDTDE